MLIMHKITSTYSAIIKSKNVGMDRMVIKKLTHIYNLASGKTSSPCEERNVWRRSISSIRVSALCSQQSAMMTVAFPSPVSSSSYAFMK